MRRNLDATEHQLREQSEIYLIEVSSNVYLVDKCRDECLETGIYVTGIQVCNVLNQNYNIGIKSLQRDLISNFQVYLRY